MSEKTRWLLTLCLVQLFIMMVFINYSAVLPQLKDEWGMNNTMAGSILYVKNRQTYGVGAGQMSRVDSSKIARFIGPARSFMTESASRFASQ